MDGIAATAAVRRLAPPPHVIVLTTFQADEQVMRALRREYQKLGKLVTEAEFGKWVGRVGHEDAKARSF